MMKYRIEIESTSVEDVIDRVRAIIRHDIPCSFLITAEGRGIVCIDAPVWLLPVMVAEVI